MASPFTTKTLSFLRSLKRHNDRDWFRTHKETYERHVRQPMIELLARLARDFRSFAPELVSEPKVCLYRIYRDTRFSEDKTPLKTHVAAHFPSRRFGRSGGAGLYIELAPGWVWMGGGMYMPSGPDLHAIRDHIAETYPRIHRIVTSRRFTESVGELGGDQLTRVPRSFSKEHPAARYLRHRQFLAGCEYEAEFATSSRFYPELLSVFRAITPLVRFLNEPLESRLTPAALLTGAQPPRDPRRAPAPDPRAAPMW